MLSRERISAVFAALDAPTDTKPDPIPAEAERKAQTAAFVAGLRRCARECEVENRKDRWLRQGLLNTPEENARANADKGRLNP